MKRKYFNLLIISFTVGGCSWFESDYYKVIRPFIELKNQERLAGKINPKFDGVVEPDFPDESKNLETIDGIDSNHDGIRDDVEIWINRSTDNDYVRVQLKDWSKKLFTAHRILTIKNVTQDDIERASQEMINSGMCFAYIIDSLPQRDDNVKVDRFIYYHHILDTLIFNSSKRKHLVDLMNGYPYKNSLTFDSNNYLNCAKGIPVSFIEKAFKANIKEWKWEK